MNNNPTPENDIALPFSPLDPRRLEIPEKKEQYLEHLLYALDALIYLYFAALYVCDNFSVLLILRLANQIVHVRSPPVSQVPPTILVSGVCILTHLLQSRATGKRLHGGILIDFVGELAPSLTRLLMLDITVFALQLVMLVAGHEKQIASGAAQAHDGSPLQDLESEEAGRLRSRAQDETAETDTGIEMQNLLPDDSGEDESAPRKHNDPVRQDDNVILLDMKKGLGAVLRRPMPITAPSTIENPAARASLATFLARVAAARGGGR